MGEFLRKLLDRSKLAYQKLSSWVARRGAWGVAAVTAGLVIVLFSGVGVTMAATGSFDAAPTSTPTKTSPPEPAATPTATPVAPAAEGDEQYNGDPSELYYQVNKLMAESWTGFKVWSEPGMVRWAFKEDVVGNKVTVVSTTSASPDLHSDSNSCFDQKGQCIFTAGYPLDERQRFCSSAGPAWIRVTLTGSAIDQTIMYNIPAAHLVCPAVEPTEPVKPAPVSPAPTPSSPEPAPTSSSEPEPSSPPVESTPTPSPEGTPSG